MKKTTYPVEMDINMMSELRAMIQYMQQHYPFVPKSLYDLEHELGAIIIEGCFKHKIKRVSFRIESNSVESVCPKCSQKRYKQLMKEFGKEE